MRNFATVCTLVFAAACGGGSNPGGSHDDLGGSLSDGDGAMPGDGAVGDGAVGDGGAQVTNDGSVPLDFAIAGPTLTAAPGINVAHLTWTAAANATSYNVYRSNAQGTQGELLTHVTDTHFDDGTVLNFQPYWYTIAGTANGQELALSNQATAFGYQLFSWTLRRSGAGLTGLAYSPSNTNSTGHDIYVAVGVAGRVITSADGILWNTAPALAAISINSVTFGGGIFVAVGTPIANDTHSIFTSTNGTDWTARDATTSNALGQVSFATSGAVITPTNLFIAVGTAGTIVTSPDGANWSRHSCGSQSLQTVSVTEHTTGSGLSATRKFMAVAGGNAELCYSTDASTWMNISLGAGTPNYIASANDDTTGTILAITADGSLAVVPYNFTTNALGSVAFSSLPTLPAGGIIGYSGMTAYTDNQPKRHFVVARNDGQLFDNTSDGSTAFTNLGSAIGGTLLAPSLLVRAIASVNTNLFVLGASEQILRSTDGGATLTIVHDDAGGSNTSVVSKNGVTLIDHRSGVVLRSTDSSTFAPVATGYTFASDDLNLVTTPTGFGISYLGTGNVTMALEESVDGQTWNETNVPVTLCNGCEIQPGPLLSTSTGYFTALSEIFGQTATQVTITGSASAGFASTLGGPSDFFVQFWQSGSTYYGLTLNEILQSQDGITWTSYATLPAQLSATSYLDFGAIKIVAGTEGRASTSSDGLTWSAVMTVDDRARTFRKLFLIGDHAIAIGDKGMVYVVLDATTWLPVETGAAGDLLDGTVTDRGLVIAGTLDTVLTVP